MHFLETLPWWALTYLGVLFMITSAGAVTTFKDDPAAAISSFFSTVCIFVFVLGIFYAPLAQFFGWFLMPMVGIGVFWELKRASIETGMAEKELENEPDLTDDERSFLINFAIILNAFIVVLGFCIRSSY